jgi:choline dehydrogenase-like flavoprotein
MPPCCKGFDVCIVGAGAAGLAMARRLVGSSLNVLVLSSGAPSDRRVPAPRQQTIYQGTVGAFLHRVDPIFLERSRLRMHGGTTNHFGFWSRPLSEADLKPRPGYRDASWPFDLSELAPYYRAAHQFGRFGPVNYDDLAFWEPALFAQCFPLLPGDPLVGATMRAQYDESLHDFHVQLGDELRAASNVTVLFNANLLSVEAADRKDHAAGLRCATIEDGKPGRGFRVEARAYVLAMGGIETVRALKLSGDLGNNRRDHLGRGFKVHPLVTSAPFALPAPSLGDSQLLLATSRCLQPSTEDGGSFHVRAPGQSGTHLRLLRVQAWGQLVPRRKRWAAEKIGTALILRFTASGDEATSTSTGSSLNENSIVGLDSAHRPGSVSL